MQRRVEASPGVALNAPSKPCRLSHSDPESEARMSMLNVDTVAINATQATVPDIPLTSDDYRFVYYRNPDRFFRAAPLHYRIAPAPPALRAYSNVIYTPATRLSKPFDGCLYDSELTRIDASCVRRQRTETLLSTEPERYEGNPSELPVYDRPVLYLGRMHRHYGHWLQESLGSWWPLAEKPDGIDRFLFHIPDPRLFERHYVKACLSAMDVAPESLLHFDRPTLLRNVLVPDPALRLHSSINLKYRDFSHKLAAALGAEDVTPTDQPMYLSKRLLEAGVRRFDGEDELETYLERRGVNIVYIEQLPFQEQVRLYNRHRTILGITGSGMLTINLALEPRTTIYFAETPPMPSCLLVDRCFESDATYLNVCTNESTWNSIQRRIKKKLTGNARDKRKNGFKMQYELDTKRATDWLSKSGYL